MEEKQYFVYITTSKNNQVLYTGITNNLKKRIYQHKSKLIDGFTKKYNTVKLVYYETCKDPEQAILREKQIKAGSRKKKLELITRGNPDFRDLYDDF